MQQPDMSGLCRCGLCSWEGEFRKLLILPSIQSDDEFVGLICPNCHELGYLEFKFDCEAGPNHIVGYIPKRLPPPEKGREPLFLNQHHAMVWHLAQWLGCEENEDAIEQTIYEGVDACVVSVDWLNLEPEPHRAIGIELHTTAGDGEEEIRTRPLKWPFTEQQLERAIEWLARQAAKLNRDELDNQRRP